jgi:hypothetical protein
VSTTISPPIRILAVVGVLAAIGLGAFLFLGNRSSSSSSHSSTPAPDASIERATAPAAVHGAVATTPKLVLLPGLPVSVSRALHHSKVVVVSVYTTGAAGDGAAVAEARKGAKAVHAGFVKVNVASEKLARGLGEFAGTSTAPPTVLVVKRPGNVVNRFDGFTDQQIVAQAAHDAGAGR